MHHTLSAAFALALVCAGLPCCAAPYIGTDTYRDFHHLTLARDTTKEYTIAVKDRLAEITVLAPHGGRLEAGTSELAEELAGNDWNYYSFMALMDSGNNRLHVTSIHYNDPVAVAMSSSALITVTLHRQREQTRTVCLGGLNKELLASADEHLKKAGFSTETPCKRLGGTDCRNIANRALLGGLQIELSMEVADDLAQNAVLRGEFIAALRQSVESVLPQLRRKAQELKGAGICGKKAAPSAK